jgi:hypothetical protein
MFRIRGLGTSALMKLLLQPSTATSRPQHVFICLADHWEPKRDAPGKKSEADRVARWVRDYPKLTESLADCRGRPPQHTFFYPAEEYDPEYLEAVAGLCRQGLGDVEVHLHHDRDTADGLREKLESYKHALHDRHGLLRKDAAGQIRYGFIHGNWALDNSRPDGLWCGVNNEISVLIETGCYADFTMPSAPAACQTSTINSIYYATDDPNRPNSHDRGLPARVGRRAPPESLLMIQGPLALDWRSRKLGLMPRIENGEVAGYRPPSLARFHLWRRARVGVIGRDDWIFIKLYTHGAFEMNVDLLLGEPMRQFHLGLRALSEQREWLRYYYVTAWEMAQLVHAAETGTVDPEAALASNALHNSVGKL